MDQITNEWILTYNIPNKGKISKKIRATDMLYIVKHTNLKYCIAIYCLTEPNNINHKMEGEVV